MVTPRESRPVAIHKTTVVQDSSGGYYGQCTCLWHSGPKRFLLKWQAEYEIHAHLTNVERALASLRRRSPSLLEEARHARAMLDDPNVSAADKNIWQILYDGAANRLNAEGVETEEETLFDLS